MIRYKAAQESDVMKNFKPNDPNDSLNSLNTNNEPSLPLPPPRQIQPTKVADIEYGLSQWGPKIRKSMQWSDPARAEEWDSFVDNTNEVVSNTIYRWHGAGNASRIKKKSVK